MATGFGVLRRPFAGAARCLLLTAFLGQVASTTARAEIPGGIPDRFRIGIGGVAAETYTDAGLGSTTAGVGASINFEDIFDLPESKETWRVEVNWRLNQRQHLDFGYFELNRTGSRVLTQDVNWGDFKFLIGARATASIDTNFPYAAWRYSFLDLPQVRISGSAGINYLTLSASLQADGGVEDLNGNVITGEVREKGSVSAPVPQFGLQLDWMLSKRLAMLMYVRQISVNHIAGIDGGVSEVAVRLHWWYSKHAGISGGFDRENIDLRSYESGDTTAHFRYEVRGFSFYFNFAL